MSSQPTTGDTHRSISSQRGRGLWWHLWWGKGETEHHITDCCLPLCHVMRLLGLLWLGKGGADNLHFTTQHTQHTLSQAAAPSVMTGSCGCLLWSPAPAPLCDDMLLRVSPVVPPAPHPPVMIYLLPWWLLWWG